MRPVSVLGPCGEVRGRQDGAVHDDMLDGLEGFTALAGDLIRSVLRKEPLCVFTCEGMSCNEAVKDRVG
jgi:hypothetical protein